MCNPASAEELLELGEVLGISSDQVCIILGQTEAKQMVALAIDRACRINEALLFQKVVEAEDSQVVELEDAMKELDCLDLFDLLNQLADGQERAVLSKLYQEGLDYHEVADQLAASVQQVMDAEKTGLANLSELYYGDGTLRHRTID